MTLNRKPCIGFRLARLQLTLANSQGQGQERVRVVNILEMVKDRENMTIVIK